MKKALFISLFLILYLFSFSQDSSYSSPNQNRPLFVVISPFGLTQVSNMEFSVEKRTEYNKMYEVSSTPLILQISLPKNCNYNFIVPSNFVVKANGGKNEIVIKLEVSNSSVDSLLGGTGKKIFKVVGSYNLTPKTTAGVYQSDRYIEIRVNFE